MDEDPETLLMTAGRRVAIEPELLGGWIEPEVPTTSQRRRAALVAGVLWFAAETMLEELFEDVTELASAPHEPSLWPDLVADSGVLSALPRRFHHRITPGVAKRLLVVTVDLVARLSYGWRPCACTAQELMLWLLLGQGIGVAETFEIDLGDWRDEVADALFEDLDFEALYDDALDGFEDDQDFVRDRMMNMRFHDWFKPFGDRRLPPGAEDSGQDNIEPARAPD